MGASGLILDEPTSGLDGRHMREMSKLLRGIADSGACVLVITHDTELINNCADTVFIMPDHRLTESSPLPLPEPSLFR